MERDKLCMFVNLNAVVHHFEIIWFILVFVLLAFILNSICVICHKLSHLCGHFGTPCQQHYLLVCTELAFILFT